MPLTLSIRSTLEINIKYLTFEFEVWVQRFIERGVVLVGEAVGIDLFQGKVKIFFQLDKLFLEALLFIEVGPLTKLIIDLLDLGS